MYSRAALSGLSSSEATVLTVLARSSGVASKRQRIRSTLLARCGLVVLGLVEVSRVAAQQRPLTTVQLARLAIPATVTILAVSELGDTVGQGSGFIVTADGIIVTNHHVMAGASSAAILLASGERFSSTSALSTNPDADVALIKIQGIDLPTLRTATTLPPLGSRIVAVGSPLGLSQTVSDGIVSGRRVTEGREMMQMSAPISPGSSGGPVLNEFGAVVAISTAYLKGGQSLNFAVPVRYAMSMLDQPHPTRSMAEVFAAPPLSSSPSPSTSPTTEADLAALAQADSARRDFCAALYLLDRTRKQLDSLVSHAPLARLTGIMAATMSAILSATLPLAQTHTTAARLAEVSAPFAAARDSAVSSLAYVDALLTRTSQRVDYRRSPSFPTSVALLP